MQDTQQQSYRAWFANRQRLQAQAKQIHEAESARQLASDCPTAQSTRDFEECYGKALDTVEAHLRDFESTLRDLMAAPPRMPGESADNIAGPAGPSLTPEQQLAEFDKLEQLWRNYRNSACPAAFHQFHGGTGGPPAELECGIRLLRDHLRELDQIYGMALHL